MRDEIFTVEELAEDVKERITDGNRKIEYDLLNGDTMTVQLWYRKYIVIRFNEMGEPVKRDKVKTDGDLVTLLKDILNL